MRSAWIAQTIHEFMGGPPFATRAGETHVLLRPFAFIVAFVLASGPGVSLLCKSQCASRHSTTSACAHHESQGSRVTEDRTCTGASLDTASFVKKDVSRGPTPNDADVEISSHPGVAEQDALVGISGPHRSAGPPHHIPTVLRL